MVTHGAPSSSSSSQQDMESEEKGGETPASLQEKKKGAECTEKKSLYRLLFFGSLPALGLFPTFCLALLFAMMPAFGFYTLDRCQLLASISWIDARSWLAANILLGSDFWLGFS
jgi:hypothetical protein